MRDFDYAVTPARLLTPEMVQMLGRIHEYKGRQDILIRLYRQDVEKNKKCPLSNGDDGKGTDYQKIYDLICTNYQVINTTPGELLQIYRNMVSSLPKGKQTGYAETEEDDGTFDLRLMLKNRDHSVQIADMSDENDEVEENFMPGFRKPGNIRPELAHMRSAQFQRSGLRFRDTLQLARSSGIERVSSGAETDPEEEVEVLCEEFLLAWEEDRIDKLILIPMFIMDLMCIRPFETENNAFCQLITLLLLLRAGYMVGKYVDFDSLVGKSYLTYVNVLQASSEGWEEEKNNYSVFAAYFLGIICQAYDEFESTLKLPGEKKKKPDRIRELIDSAGTRVTKKQIISVFPDISKVTVERTLTDLVKKGYIVKVGAGPSTGYVRAADAEDS